MDYIWPVPFLAVSRCLLEGFHHWCSTLVPGESELGLKYLEQEDFVAVSEQMDLEFVLKQVDLEFVLEQVGLKFDLE